MDPTIFQPNAPGTVIPIGNGEYAFVPNPLPPAGWTFPPDLWPLLADAKQQLGILEGLGRNLPNPAILLRPLADREAIRSSRLEGTYATAKELLLFDLEPRESTSELDRANDQREVFNYRRALFHGTNTELPLSARLLKDMHRILLESVRGRDRAPGEFRKVQVAIGGGSTTRFVPPPPERLLECVDPFEKHLHTTSSPFDPLVDSFLAHYQFETIHPFLDGNGRVGRLLLAIMLQQRCGLSKPWLYMSEYFDKNRDDYINYLFRVSTHANWHDWLEFCIQGTIVQAKDTVSRCERLRIAREEFMQRVTNVGGSVRLNLIVENIFHSPFVRVADLPARLGVTYPTARADIQRLVDAEILQEVPNTTPRTFYAPEVYNIAYDDLDNE